LFGEEGDVLADTHFQLLLLASLMIVLGTTLVSPILNILTGVFGVSPTTIGLLVTAQVAPAVILIPVGGVLADHWGRRPVLIAGLVLFGTGGAAIALTTDFRVALALRGIQGAGYAFTFPATITTIRDYYSGGREATGQGLRLATGGVSNVVFPLIAGVIVTVSWRLPFLLYVLALVVAGMLFVWFEEPAADVDESAGSASDGAGGNDTTEHSTPTDDVGASTVVSGGGEHAGSAAAGNVSIAELRGRLRYVQRVLELTARRHVVAILGGRVLMTVAIISFLTYNSLLVDQILNETPRTAGFLVALWATLYTVAATQAGRITEWWGYTAALFGANICLGVGLMLFAIAPSVIVAGISAAFVGFGVGVSGGLYRSLISGFAPRQFRGGLVGAGEALGRLGATVTPAVMGLAIGLLEPHSGTALSLQIVVGGTGLLVGAGGVGCVLVYHLSTRSGRNPAV
jgi:MFS family permease